MAIRSSGANPVCVLDLGGACGGHYYYVKNILKGRIDWLVVETPAMVGKAKILEEDGLTFSCNFSQALGETDKYHLMHSSGTIQYLPDPTRVLRDMIQRRADILLLNRLMVAAQGESMILIQRSMLSANGPGSLPAGVVDRECRYPITCLAKRQIEDCIREEYDILLRFEDPTEYRIGGYPVRNVGYLAERR
jgi:putative methyltransferase (TIGR04325 family)